MDLGGAPRLCLCSNFSVSGIETEKGGDQMYKWNKDGQDNEQAWQNQTEQEKIWHLE